MIESKERRQTIDRLISINGQLEIKMITKKKEQ